MEFLKLLWNEREINILDSFEGVGKLLTARQISKKSGIEKSEVKKILLQLFERGTIIKIANQYGLIPLAPGVLELYYLKRGDPPKKQKKIAIKLREFMDTILPPMFLDVGTPLLRPKLPLNAEEKLIEINEKIDSKSQVLPYELAGEMIKRNDIFVALPCQCRLIAELAGEPCKRSSHELGCIAAGLVAQQLISMGIGRKITEKEAIEILNEAEKRGLIHNGTNSMGPESFMLICNCCPDCCALLTPTKKFGVPGVEKSNFIPNIDFDLCVKCEACIEKCPMDAIYHRWPMEADDSDEKIIINYSKCIGCGVCSKNCPKNAIKMKKMENQSTIPEKPLIDINIFRP
ncbi:MAG: 4Fe-4S dicluster domain-containing protein [Candidatus Lokiarchaeota archaeon]|nr:4Fe-4S dicluster domain-containing protein [Candidatus Lokiarchaeota archaeon]